MRFLSVCSGIEAASVAWNPLGWKAVGFSEIEPFPCAVLAHHYPDVPNYGDLTKWKEWGIERGSVDLICGGTPCQSFSVAGLRKGLADPRGNLMLVYLGLVEHVRPRWVVWENVPGVLSSNGGRDFGTFLGALGKLGYGWSYRVLDAQYVRVDGFGRAVPQRRRRVFVVGHLGNWQRAAAVLFERESLSGHPVPRREAGKGFAASTCPSLTASGRGVERAGETRGQDPVVAVTLRCEGFNASEDGTGRQTLIPARMVAFGEYVEDDTASAMKAIDYKDATDLVSCAEVAPSMTAGGAPFARTGNERTECEAIIAIHDKATRHKGGGDSRNGDGAGNGLGISETGEMYTLTSGDKHAVAVGCFKAGQGSKAGSIGYDEAVSPTLGAADSGSNRTPPLMQSMSVRRLTPVECERLMGFPDNYTRIHIRPVPAKNQEKSRRLFEQGDSRFTEIAGAIWVTSADGPRYKALGNSWAVNCARWVGTRCAVLQHA